MYCVRYCALRSSDERLSVTGRRCARGIPLEGVLPGPTGIVGDVLRRVSPLRLDCGLLLPSSAPESDLSPVWRGAALSRYLNTQVWMLRYLMSQLTQYSRVERASRPKPIALAWRPQPLANQIRLRGRARSTRASGPPCPPTGAMDLTPSRVQLLPSERSSLEDPRALGLSSFRGRGGARAAC